MFELLYFLFSTIKDSLHNKQCLLSMSLKMRRSLILMSELLNATTKNGEKVLKNKDTLFTVFKVLLKL